jgi:serine/threonine protein kinase
VLLERYALDEVIGAGGAAKVFRADDRALDRVVAVKVLDDAIARSADPGGRERFLHEARSAARFQHPNLVTVYDAGEDGGELFLVMEYVDGRSLADVIAERAPMPVDESVSIASQILGGLAAVHAHGTIHRDVKPANVLVDIDGRVRLADFGIAKRLDDIEAAVTAAGTLVGTPHYLAPEQATGQPLSPATDVYQVGLVLDEMLTGERAGGSTPVTAASASPVDPRRARSDVPDRVATAVVRATQPDPSRRFQSATAMIATLAGEAASNANTTVVPAPPRAQPRPQAADGRLPTATMPADGATMVVPRLVPPAPDPAGVRRRRNTAVFGVALLLVAVAGALAMLFGGDTHGRLLPGTETSVAPASTTATLAPTVVTTAPVVVVVTSPPAAVDDDKPDDDKPDDDKGKGNGNGKKRDDD